MSSGYTNSAITTRDKCQAAWPNAQASRAPSSGSPASCSSTNRWRPSTHVARRLLAPTVAAFRTVPSLAWVPLLLLWFGIDETPKVLLVAIGAFFPIYTTTASALSHVDAQLLEVGRAYGRHGASLLTTVMLPAAAPELVNGLRLGMANAWLFLVAAELIASSRGLGFLLIDSQNTGRTDVMLLAIVLLAGLGKLSDTAFGTLEQRIVRRRS